jgi:hypothetical protein
MMALKACTIPIARIDLLPESKFIDVDKVKNAKGFPVLKPIALYKSRNVEDLEAATPERLAMSEDSIITVDGARQFEDELLMRLGKKGQLWPEQKANEALQLAGIKYYEDWYNAGMGGLQAIDYGKVSGGQGGSGSSMPPSRMAAQARASYRAARASMPAKYRKPVEAIILEGQSDLVAVGRAATGAKDRSLARSMALERFTAGLYLLAKHYVFLA